MSPTSSHNENPEGDRLFLEMLYESYNRLMFHQASRYFQNQTDIEDVVQQAFIKLMRYIPTLKKLNRNTLAAYIVNVIRTCSMDIYRKRKMERETSFSDFYEGFEEKIAEDDDLDDMIDTSLSMEALTDAILELPEEDQFVLEAKYLQGWSDSTIAEHLGVKKNTVRTRILRAKKKALSKLRGKYDD